MKQVFRQLREGLLPPTSKEYSNHTQAPFKPKTQQILLLDDEPVFGEIISLFAQRYYAEVTSVPLLKTALDIVHRGMVFDVVIIDYRLTNGDGIQFYREIVHKWVRSHVIFLSGYVDTKLIEEVSKVGPARVYSKNCIREREFLNLLFMQCGLIRKD